MTKRARRTRRAHSRAGQSGGGGGEDEGPFGLPRRDSRGSELPLTDRNLRTLLEQTNNRFGTVALDMESRERRMLDGSIDSGLLFGELNPSSEHLSDSTSLDDVCFPDYYDTETPAAVWPDLDVLAQFVDAERDELSEESHQGEVNFQHPVAVCVLRNSGEVSPREEAPLLGSVRVSEVTETSSMRVRPRPFQPWDQDVSPILNKKTACRFTYFRDDLSATTHSPLLLGLVSGDTKASLAGLFRPLSYMENGTRTPKAGSGTPKMTAQTTPKMTAATIGAQGGAGGAAGLIEPDTRVSPFWLDVLDPTEEEMKVLAKTFGLHPLTTEDIFLGETREKVEVFRQYYFMCFTSFDIVHERRKARAKEHEKKLGKLSEYARSELSSDRGWVNRLFRTREDVPMTRMSRALLLSKGKKIRLGELCPLNMYMIVFEHGVLTFHFSATPHPVNVRRRVRLLKDYLTVSSDWLCYALIDDITDLFAPMIDSIESEVYSIEDEIMRMHSGSVSELEESDDDEPRRSDVFYRRARLELVVEHRDLVFKALRRRPSELSGSRSTTSLSRVVAWKRKGDMLRRIGECRKRVMSVLRLLGTKADVIKGFAKRFHDTHTALREIVMYLGDISDHVVTMVQLLNHYEKLLARSHLNYLAQINIDMTKVNNDTNDVLGKITVLGTIVLPINVVTGLWGMNCIVPGQDHPGLTWFYGILLGISMFSCVSYFYAKKVTGL